MSERERILKAAQEKFFREGFSKVSMDMIAAELKMSKKTIYKYYRSKDALLRASVQNLKKNVKKNIGNILKDDLSSIEKIALLADTLKSMAANRMSANWINDIRVYKPEIWKEIEEMRTRIINKHIYRVFIQGIEEGYIVDIPPQIILAVFLSSVKSVINPDFILENSFSLKEAVDYTFGVFLNGILTDKGKEVYNKIIKNKRSEENEKDFYSSVGSLFIWLQ
ncbi:transcriptional regulator, TetR family [Melioribacter roseus P3M-2]|uniref:Transcriptional regulator, TetR family n=1 Tax=Melioribacter roseus (strain DSM 23840 / JCM 17771 / VKM B-2668 / P3M-2) TaxID=1191523 RepID=I6ZQ39_MELRP|nr:TetR/AcrR family transcriptional regulator [Melioribacter roseus]AFN74184.1 transcriptional regulator, TetR family [Melioribacter roseus P3M-2]